MNEKKTLAVQANTRTITMRGAGALVGEFNIHLLQPGEVPQGCVLNNIVRIKLGETQVTVEFNDDPFGGQKPQINPVYVECGVSRQYTLGYAALEHILPIIERVIDVADRADVKPVFTFTSDPDRTLRIGSVVVTAAGPLKPDWQQSLNLDGEPSASPASPSVH